MGVHELFPVSFRSLGGKLSLLQLFLWFLATLLAPERPPTCSGTYPPSPTTHSRTSTLSGSELPLQLHTAMKPSSCVSRRDRCRERSAMRGGEDYIIIMILKLYRSNAVSATPGGQLHQHGQHHPDPHDDPIGCQRLQGTPYLWTL